MVPSTFPCPWNLKLYRALTGVDPPGQVNREDSLGVTLMIVLLAATSISDILITRVIRIIATLKVTMIEAVIVALTVTILLVLMIAIVIEYL